MISRRTFLAGCLPAALTACSSSEIVRTLEAAARGGSLSGAVRNVATSKATSWARNPKTLVRDFERLDEFAKKFLGDVVTVWGEENAQTPQKKVFVKYSDNYKSRGIVDFDKALVRVETLVPSHLKDAIVMTVLSPDDPTNMDLFSDKSVKLGGVPFLYEQVVDQDGKAIRWAWRANRFADYLIKTQKKTQTIKLDANTTATKTYVEFPLARVHNATRQNRYSPLVNRYTAQYGIERALVYAIIKTESNFNPYAVSWVPAYGLMQIVPTTAGRDAYQLIHKRAGTPTRDYLFNAENNIRMGCAYLYILQNRYLANVTNPTSRHYCVIAAYNGGAGNVLKSFHSNRTQAFAEINRSSPTAVYNRLKAKMPTESQRYLDKVLHAKRDYS
jgi:membrane-bound lytic murein transglycosylase C